MNQDQAVVFAILAAAMTMFLWGRWRHDMVAVGALLACVAAGLVPAGDAFLGFGHPAVITVACVLVMSRSLLTSGAVDVLARVALPQAAGPTATIAALAGLAAVLSAFMNNVGALALLMPIALQVAARLGLPAGKVLMPVAFASILGGMTTLIGTPPNLIVAGFRADTGQSGFAMFDFAPVGVAVAVVGVVFVVLARRLVPGRERTDASGFETGAYVTEVRVPDEGKAAGMTLRALEEVLEEADAQVIGLIRNEVRISAPNPMRALHPGDVLLIEAEPEGLATMLSSLDLRLEEAVRKDEEDENPEDEDAEDENAVRREKDGVAAADPGASAAPAGTAPAGHADEAAGGMAEETAEVAHKTAKDEKPSADIALVEMAVLPTAALAGRAASELGLRTRYGVNLLAISRQGRHSITRLRRTPIRAGDVLLLQGPPESLAGFATQFGCVPLAERALRLPNRRQAMLAVAIMAAAVAGAAFGLLPAAVSFAAGVLAVMAVRLVPPRSVYEAVDWPVIVLLGALIPVAGAMESTGAADLVARLLLENVAQGLPVIGVVTILVVTMFLSDFMNNAATAAVMCPIAIGTANQLGANADPFLMAVAVGASCAFLTPIGHQNNTLILGPGGFRFGDYWRLGLPLEVLIVIVGVPAILFFWPL
ncbi:MAG: SLC13 family permease [Alphaproteobacteria bacterium]